MFLNNRHYDPSTGVFVSVDPLVTLTGEPYIYGSANPVTMSDPSGLCSVISGNLFCGGSNFGAGGRGIDYLSGIDIGMHRTINSYAGTSVPLNAAAVGGCDYSAGECGALAGFVMGGLQTVAAPLFLGGALIEDPGAVVDAALDPQTYIDAALSCFSGQQGAGECVGEAVTGGVVAKSAAAGRACRSFSGGTEVLMADGTSKRIDLLQVGDMVLAEDPETGERGPRPVVDVWFHDDLLIDLRIEDERLTTTEDHRMWNATDRAWQESQDIDPGEAVLTADGEHLEVGGLDWSSATIGAAYNLTVDDIHTYFVTVDGGSVLVHNCIRNGHLAGKTHPKTGVPFDDGGFPVFDRWRHPDVDDVMIDLSGNRKTDRLRANQAAGLSGTPRGYTWHHHQTPGLMQLVQRTIHAKTGHTGSFSKGRVR